MTVIPLVWDPHFGTRFYTFNIDIYTKLDHQLRSSKSRMHIGIVYITYLATI